MSKKSITFAQKSDTINRDMEQPLLLNEVKENVNYTFSELINAHCGFEDMRSSVKTIGTEVINTYNKVNSDFEVLINSIKTLKSQIDKIQ